ncbi:MAG: hypothetical protein HRT44_07975, partial [Bdellovibrionales bacterium]|nr:hypothetical protein [Bdellovibrionales bacterium]NQZ19176.1 hypothetical protein [Bdellovibrionales bacterium]
PEMDKAQWDPENEEFGYDLEAGDVITNVVYGGEGWCGGTHINGKGVKTDVSFFCDLESDKVEIVQDNWQTEVEQWIYLQCKEGNKAFIKDSTSMSLPNVSQGDFDGYGQVAPTQ